MQEKKRTSQRWVLICRACTPQRPRRHAEFPLPFPESLNRGLVSLAVTAEPGPGWNRIELRCEAVGVVAFVAFIAQQHGLWVFIREAQDTDSICINFLIHVDGKVGGWLAMGQLVCAPRDAIRKRLRGTLCALRAGRCAAVGCT